jgi:TldD protein
LGRRTFSDTDGSYIDQDVHRIWAPMSVTAIDKASGKFRSRDGLSSPMGMGYEYLDGSASGKVIAPNGVINYSNSYDMIEDAIAAAKQAREKLKAPSVKPGKYDLVLDPSHLWLTIHESVGHPLELDRVLATKPTTPAPVSRPRTSARKVQYGSDMVTLRRQDPAGSSARSATTKRA